MSTTLYPLFLRLQERVCVLVGGNAMAEAKTRELLDAGAEIRLIAPVVTEQISEWSRQGRLQWEPHAYKAGDLRDAFLVVSVGDPQTNAEVFAEAEMRHIFCNAVDDIPHCNCYASAVVRRGPLQIAISTSGNSPALAQRLRKQLEEQFGEEYAPWVERLGELRSELVQHKSIDGETRRRILHEQASSSAFERFQNVLRQEKDAHISVAASAGCRKSG